MSLGSALDLRTLVAEGRPCQGPRSPSLFAMVARTADDTAQQQTLEPKTLEQTR